MTNQGEELTKNKKIVLKNYVKGMVKESDMEVLNNESILLRVQKGSNAVLLKNLYLSCEPYMHSCMTKYEDEQKNYFEDEQKKYVPPFTLGLSICSNGVSKVLYSDNPELKPGDYVRGMTSWEEYSLIRTPKQLVKIIHNDIPLSYYTGILGYPGLAAYFGFRDICNPKEGDRVFVSSACGAVGQIVGQFAKLMGCYVVGSVGSDEKVDIVKNHLGFCDAFNYKKEPDLNAALKRCFPEGIDIYFDNVGGAMLNAALLNMRIHGRIAACGMISQYNLEEPEGLHNLFCIVTKRIRMEGFMIPDYFHRYCEFEEETIRYIREGKIKYVEDIAEGLDSAPAALVRLFKGHNVGKQLVVVARESEASIKLYISL